MPMDTQNRLNPVECDPSVDFSRVVGEKTVENGGFFGDLITLSRAHIADAKDSGELTEAAAGQVLAAAVIEAMKQAVIFELQYKKTEAETCGINRGTELKAEEVKLKSEKNKADIEHMKCQCDIAENELRIKQDTLVLERDKINAEIEKSRCICDIEKEKKDSEIKVNEAKITKMACDCCNSGKVMEAQAELYKRQTAGFDDHSNLKLLEAQLQSMAAIFADQDGALNMPYILQDSKLCNTYDRIVQRLNGHFNEDGEFVPGTGEDCTPAQK
jgi:hypothetical protein